MFQVHQEMVQRVLPKYPGRILAPIRKPRGHWIPKRQRRKIGKGQKGLTLLCTLWFYLLMRNGYGCSAV